MLVLQSIIQLLNACPRLTHLSLTGVQAFLRDEFQQFGREAPREFTEHQRQVFCVFSGNCVNQLRDYLNSASEYKNLRESSRYRAIQQAAGTAQWLPLMGPDVAEEQDAEGPNMFDGSEVEANGVLPPPPPPPPPVPASLPGPPGQAISVFATQAPSPEGTPESGL